MVHLSPTAVAEIKRLRAKQTNPNILFRLQVQAGGCYSWFYNIKFDQDLKQGDHLYAFAGISVVVDAQSLNFITGLRLDYSEDLMGGGFRFYNPNAITTCGCGNSFSTSADTHS